MPPMFVTLDVSQLEMSALKFCKFWKSPPMSVMADTSQLAMGPYVAMAAVGLVLYAWTAFCRESLVVKVYEAAGLGLVGGDDGDGGGGLGLGGGGDGDGGEGLGGGGDGAGGGGEGLGEGGGGEGEGEGDAAQIISKLW